MDDYLRQLGLRTVLVGKTHMTADVAGLDRLRIAPDSNLGVLVSQCGFEPFERDDGLHADDFVDPNLAYNRYLRERGYESDNPWHDFANSVEGPNGEVLSGWYNASHASARSGGRRRLRDRLYDQSRHGFRARSGGYPLVHAFELHQTALALYRSESVPRYVRPGTSHPGQPQRDGTRMPSPGGERLSAA